MDTKKDSPFNWKATPSTLSKDPAFDGRNAAKGRPVQPGSQLKLRTFTSYSRATVGKSFLPEDPPEVT